MEPKFVVLEIQANPDDKGELVVSTLVTDHKTRDEAEQKYHAVLSAAAVSKVFRHSANLLDSNGQHFKGETYFHDDVVTKNSEIK